MNILKYAAQEPTQVAQELNTNLEKGLTQEEAAARFKQYGRNEITYQESRWWNILLDQWRSPFIYLLVAAALIAFFVTKDYFEGVMILIIVAINTLLGFYQEYKASQALMLLKSYIISYSKVMRVNHQLIIESASLVPGDIVILEPGDVVPADIRIASEQGLFIDESVLTGESTPVMKTVQAVAAEPKELFQATNMCFAGTTVVSGKATGIVVATGQTTSLGQITSLMTQTVRESSFARGITRFSNFILRFVLITIVCIFFANVIVKHKSVFDGDLLIFAVALAVTIIPEMLPTVATFSLAQGAVRLARQKVVVKRLTAIEDLGSIQILCTDKTGTLTENKLKVADVFGSKKEETLLYATLMATQASLQSKKHAAFAFDNALWDYMPEEERHELSAYKFVDEVPFEPERRRSSVVVKHNNNNILIVRGAYEEVLKHASNITEKLHKDVRAWIAEQGKEGRRVIAVAQKTITHDELSDLRKAEKGLEFLGIIAFVDPIKKTTLEAIKEAQVLGVKIKILTGDSPEVAQAVAQKVGLIAEGHDIVTGDHFADMSEDEKRSAATHHTVFARISPSQKYEIINFLKKHHSVGYLGDGINDAPALKLANVAIVVKGAADVAQEAADIVLLKKSLFVIIDGIREGRKIFANTIKYLKTTIFSNFGHFYSIAIGSLLLDYVPMLPIQMLLLNVITDFPMIAIATDNVDVDQLQEPRNYNIRDIALFSLILSPISTIFDFIIFGLFHKQAPEVLQTNWFIGAVVTELLIILSLRSHRFFLRATRPSWTLLGIIFIGCGATIALPYTALGQTFFHFIPPTAHQLKAVALVSLGYFFVTEYAKLLYYRIMNTKPKKHH